MNITGRMELCVSIRRDVCPMCGGEDEFYQAMVGPSLSAGFHCLHCNFERDSEFNVVSFPRPRNRWVGVD